MTQARRLCTRLVAASLYLGMAGGICVTGHSQSPGVALVIGNTNYPSGKLDNAVSDATDIAAALKDLGFDVTVKQDLAVHDFATVIDAFQAKVLASPGLAVFYFSGHGIQVNGANYLIPIDAAIASTTDVAAATISLQRVFNALGGRAGLPNLIILDSCRSNPFPSTPDGWVAGLANPTNPPPNSLIAYSTSPGSVAADGIGTHSPFTRALLRFMRSPGISIPDVFSEVRSDVEANTDMIQVPWDNTSLTGNVYFRKPVFFVAQFTSPADDDAMVMVNGEVVSDWNQDGGVSKRIQLTKSQNEVVVKVYNQRSYTGGIPGLGGHLPEGWHYDLQLKREDGTILIPLSGKEDVPADNGPHHGKLFTVATLRLDIDDKTGAIRVEAVDPAVWTH
jgi:hypothetical protein